MNYKNNEELKVECAKTLKVLEKLETPIEVRMLNTNKGTKSGYYENKEKLIRDIAMYDGKNNIFFTLNDVEEDLLARGKDKLVDYAKNTTSDSEITRRGLLLIDIDPKRPAGVSSTDEELKSANEVADNIRDFLTEQGFPKPIKAISGNGYHLIYKVNLNNTQDITKMIKAFLSVLDSKFSNDRAEVDKSTFNASRITKLYGTIACKGENTESRPHRRSKIINVPIEFDIVEEELIKNIVESFKKIDLQAEDVRQASSKINVKEWLESHDIKISHEKPYGDDGICYVLETCPWNSTHTDKSASVIQFSNGAISAKCHHASCSEENWTSLRQKYEPKISKQNTEYSNNYSDDTKKSQADVLIELALDSNDVFFHNSMEETYVAIDCSEFYQVHKIQDKKYQLLLRKRFYDKTQKAPSKDSINQALGVLESKALYEGEKIAVARRCTSIDETIYYDVGDDKATIIKIDKDGWKVDEDKQILFMRRNNMKPQVMPTQYDDLVGILSNHFRFKHEDDRVLHTVAMVTKLIPYISHPIEVIYGEKGAAKTTTMKMSRDIIDPAIRDVVSMPKGVEDLALSLTNNYMPCFDNLDNISPDKSDLLCIASTGGAFSKRKLYSDDDETILSFKSRVTLNGINVVATRADLLDRCIILALERIPQSERKEEVEVWNAFNEDKPKILGAIFSTLSKAINIYPKIKLDKLGRMADFTKWGYAVAEACGIGGEVFLEAYLNNQKKANLEAVESNPVAVALIKYINNQKHFEDTVSTLLIRLNEVAEIEHIDTLSKLWPKEPNVLSRRLNELKSNLEMENIHFNIRQRTHGKVIEVVKIE